MREGTTHHLQAIFRSWPAGHTRELVSTISLIGYHPVAPSIVTYPTMPPIINKSRSPAVVGEFPQPAPQKQQTDTQQDIALSNRITLHRRKYSGLRSKMNRFITINELKSIPRCPYIQAIIPSINSWHCKRFPGFIVHLLCNTMVKYPRGPSILPLGTCPPGHLDR